MNGRISRYNFIKNSKESESNDILANVVEFSNVNDNGKCSKDSHSNTWCKDVSKYSQSRTLLEEPKGLPSESERT